MAIDPDRRHAPVTGGSTADFSAFLDAIAPKWRLLRTGSDGSRFVGAARFSRSEGHCDLREDGLLALANGQSLRAFRCWRWAVGAQNGLQVLYGEAQGGGLYHDVALQFRDGVWTGSGGHACGRDFYAATYRIAPHRIEISHRVSGPAKDYWLEAIFDLPTPAAMP